MSSVKFPGLDLVPGSSPVGVNALPGSSPAILSVWNEAKRSNAFINASAASSTFVLDINVTDAGRLKGYDINVTFNPTFLTVKTVDFYARQSVVYDSNLNGLYNTGEPVISGINPTGITPAVIADTRIKFAGTGSWVSGQAVVYDLNNNGLYTQGEPLIGCGTSTCTRPTVGATLTADTHFKVFDPRHLGSWQPSNCQVAEGCLFDRLYNNAVGTPGTTTLTNSTSNVVGWTRLSITDSNATTPFVGTSTTPFAGTGVLFRIQFSVKAVGQSVINILSSSQIFNPGPVSYENVDGYFDNAATPALNYSVAITAGIGGCATAGVICLVRPISGRNSTTLTPLTVAVTFSAGSQTVTLSVLGLPNFAQASFSPPSGSTTFTSTLTLRINGTTPAIGTTVKTDSKVRFFDSNSNNVWDPGEPVAYDSNNNGLYDSGEPVIAGSAPSAGATLKNDPISPQSKIKYVDSNNNNVWDVGEALVYDSNSDNQYNSGEAVVSDSTTPSGTFPILVTGNATISSPTPTHWLVETAGASLKVVPPPPPKFVLTGTVLKPTVEAGNYTLLGINTTLVRGSVEHFQLDSNVAGQVPTASLTFNPTNALLPSVYNVSKLISTANITTSPTVSPQSIGVYKFNITATSSGEFSELSQQAVLTIILTLTRTHDPGLSSTTTSKNFAYSGTSFSITVTIGVFNQGAASDTFTVSSTATGDSNVIVGSTPSSTAHLKTDPKIAFIDSNGNGLWDPGEQLIYDSNTNTLFNGNIRFVDANTNNAWDTGETVVYDLNGNGLYDAGEQVLLGSTPALSTTLKIDPKIKFVDFSRNGDWDAGEPVIYDTNNNGVFDAGEPQIAGPTATSLLTDAKIKFMDSNGNAAWNPGESVVYDTDSSGTYTAGDTVLAGGTPFLTAALSTDSKLKFVDKNANAAWDSGESVVYDSNSNGIFDPSETVIAGPVPPAVQSIVIIRDGNMTFVDSNSNTVWDSGESIIYSYKVKFVDTNANGVWDSGESVVLDSNNNGVYDISEPVISGATPAGSTALKVDPKITFVDSRFNGANQFLSNNLYDVGEMAFVDSNGNGLYDSGEPVLSSVKTDAKILYFDTNSNNVWDLGEPVIYDADSSGTYSPGTPSPDTLIVGTFLGVTLKSSSKVLYFDANSNNVWDLGEPVIYDADSSGTYTAGDSIISGTAPALSSVLKSSSKILYFDANNNNAFDFVSSSQFEAVIYDADSSGTYTGSDSILGGTFQGVTLKTDSHIKYFDTDNSNTWGFFLNGNAVVGETIIYDTNSNNLYDTGETVIIGTVPQSGPLRHSQVALGSLPAGGTALVTDAKIKFRDFNDNKIWDQGEFIVYDSNSDGFYSSAEPIMTGIASIPPADLTITGSTPTKDKSLATTDSKIKFVDANSNNVWDSGETIVYDSNTNGLYDTTAAITSQPVTVAARELVVNGTATPVLNAALSAIANVKYLDINGNGHWDPREPVVLDPNGNGFYNTNEPVIVAYTGLNVTDRESVVYDDDNSNTYSAGDTAMSVATPPPNFGTALKTDSKIKYVDSNSNNIWDSGELVVYDSDNSNTYNAGDIVIAGAAPIKTDSKIKYVDSNSNFVWDTGEPVIYDNDNSNTYSAGDAVIAGATPTLGTALKADSKIKYVDSNSNNVRDSTELVVYDKDNNIMYNAGDIVIAGAAPIKTDSKIKYVDSNSNNVWDSNSGAILSTDTKLKLAAVTGGHAVVYDINSNNQYDNGAATVAQTWSAGTLPRGTYTVVSTITQLTGEFDTDNNDLASNAVTVRFKGDWNNDLTVNIIDLSAVGATFGLATPAGNPYVDMNNDGTVNIIDLSVVGANFGNSAP